MINVLFHYLTIFDSWLASFLPGLMRVGLYGAFSGLTTVIIYAAVSNQSRIRELKTETKRLRHQMRDRNLDYREMIQISKTNLNVSSRLLGHVLWPCALSSLPPILFIAWLTNSQSYTLPANGKPVSVTFIPETAPVVIEPAPVRSDAGNGKQAVAIEAGQALWFGVEGKTVYVGVIAEHPVETVRKKRWWNTFVTSEAGYIRPNAPVDEIVFDFPRKRFVKSGPVWLATWEFPFFLLLCFSSLTTKLVFRVE